MLPPVQSLELPRPVPPELFDINEPGPESPVLVSGNSEFTLAVMTGILATTVSPFYLLLADCRGDTVDMSMIFRSFTPQRLDQSLGANGLAGRVTHRRLITPGDHRTPAGGAGRLHRLGNHRGAHLRRGTAPVHGRGLAAAAGLNLTRSP